MANLMPLPKMRFTDKGRPLVGGKVYFYVAGTTTPKNTFKDRQQATLNANPVVLDANGEADIWFEMGYYKVVLKDADGATVWTADQVAADANGLNVDDLNAAVTAAQAAAETAGEDAAAAAAEAAEEIIAQAVADAQAAADIAEGAVSGSVNTFWASTYAAAVALAATLGNGATVIAPDANGIMTRWTVASGALTDPVADPAFNGVYKLSWAGTGDVSTALQSLLDSGRRVEIDENFSGSATLRASTDWRLLSGAGTITLKIHNSDYGSDLARAIAGAFSPARSLELQTVMDALKAGSAVKIACFGDSTTAGIATTSYTPNSASGGEATGPGDETANSPNAFPYVMRGMLQDMYDNASQKVYNNGYSGVSAANGWALRNYASAVVNNPDIGHPSVALIQFGLNDVNLVGYQLSTFIAEMEKICRLCIGFGTLPVLVSSNPSATGAGTNRDNKLMETLDASKKALAQRLGIPFFDHHAEIKYFMANNRDWRDSVDDYRWARIQNDGTHMNDNGHLFKASFFSALLYSGTVWLNDAQEYVALWDSRANTIADFDNNQAGTNPKNTRLHKDGYIASAPTSTPLMRVYVWNRGFNTACIYRGVGHEGWAGAVGTPPQVTVDSLSTAKADLTSTPNAVYQTVEGDYMGSDVPYYVGRIFGGLNLVSYISGSVTYNAYVGSFEFVQDYDAELSKRVVAGYRYKGSTEQVFHALEKPAMANLVYVPEATNNALRIHLDCYMPQNTGVLLWWAQSFDGTAASWTYDKKVGVFLVRNASDQYEIRLIRFGNNGITSSVTIATSSAGTITNDIVHILVVVNRDASTNGQRWRIYQSENLVVPTILDTVIGLSSDMAPWAGIAGGAYNATASLKEMHIRYMDAWIAV